MLLLVAIPVWCRTAAQSSRSPARSPPSVEVAVPRPHAVAIVLIFASRPATGPSTTPARSSSRTIRFEGNHAISSGDLRDGLALHRAQKLGSAPDPYLVDGRPRARQGHVLAPRLPRGRRPLARRAPRRRRDGDLPHRRGRARDHARRDQRPAATIPHYRRPRCATGSRSPMARRSTTTKYDKAKEQLLSVVEDAGYAHAKLDARVVVDRANHEAIVEPDVRRRAQVPRSAASTSRARPTTSSTRSARALRSKHGRAVLGRGDRVEPARDLRHEAVLDRSHPARQGATATRSTSRSRSPRAHRTRSASAAASASIR